MIFPPRDAATLRFVAQFGQATAKQIDTAVFHSPRSATTCNRVLQKLLKENLLDRIGLRGQWVYILGAAGQRLVGLESRYRARNPNFHTLAITDAYCELTKLQQAGKLYVRSVLTEPDCWTSISGVELRPDLVVEVALPERPGRAARTDKLLLEIDMGTELARQLRTKLKAYVEAFLHLPADQTFPGVLWLVPDATRQRQLENLIGQTAEPDIFGVRTFDGMPTLYT